MRYSAQVRPDYARYIREIGAKPDIQSFVRLFWERRERPGLRVPKAMTQAFADLPGPAGNDIRQATAAWQREETAWIEQDLFKQHKRLAQAERKLQMHATKAATESRRIAPAKVEQMRGWFDDLRRTTPESRDAPTYPPRPLLPRARVGGRLARAQADALPVSPRRQARAPRPQVSRHLRRTARQPRGLLDEQWLQPGTDLARLYTILDDRVHPYYEHRQAA